MVTESIDRLICQVLERHDAIHRSAGEERCMDWPVMEGINSPSLQEVTA
ncbi:MAG: hypothetical protein JZU70_09235 [Chlorobium sp.]|nr:hypothetical protein [Chlorobium sp.]